MGTWSDRHGCCVESPISSTLICLRRSLVEEDLERTVAPFQKRLYVGVRRLREVVAGVHLVSPALQLAQVLLELFKLGVGEFAVFGLACDVCQKLFGFTADLGVFFGAPGTELCFESLN